MIEIENVVGIKDTLGNLPLLAKIFDRCCNDLILPAYAVGLGAVILAKVNVAPNHIIALEDYLNSGKLSEAWGKHWQLTNLIDVICPADNFPVASKNLSN